MRCRTYSSPSLPHPLHPYTLPLSPICTSPSMPPSTSDLFSMLFETTPLLPHLFLNVSNNDRVRENRRRREEEGGREGMRGERWRRRGSSRMMQRSQLELMRVQDIHRECSFSNISSSTLPPRRTDRARSMRGRRGTDSVRSDDDERGGANMHTSHHHRNSMMMNQRVRT